jgi:hypothetical protein
MNTNAGPLHYDKASPSLLRDTVGCFGSDRAQSANGGPLPVCSQTNSASNNVCTAFKDAGVQVYTIAFGEEVTTGPQAPAAQAFLQNCASARLDGSKQFFIAPDAATLLTVFSDILTSTQNVRIID